MRQWKWPGVCLMLMLTAYAILLMKDGITPVSHQVLQLQHAPYSLGGAGGVTTSTFNDMASVATPTATAKSRLFGARGNNGTTCLGTSGTPVEMVKRDFRWGPNILTPAYRSNTSVRLCNDYWFWQSEVVSPASEILQSLHWPTDLLLKEYRSQVVTVDPLSLIDPQTNKEQFQEMAQQFESTGPCDWVPNLVIARPHINICDPIKGLIRAMALDMRTNIIHTQDQISFLWQTAISPFTDEKNGLPGFWRLSWAIVLMFLTAVIAWIGLRIVTGAAISWLSYSSLLELLPRLFLGLLAAFFSKELLLALIQGNNTFAHLFSQTTFQSLLVQQESGTVADLLQLLYSVMGFLLIAEEAGRIAVLYLLFAFSPLLLFCAALRETEHIARAAVKAALLFSFLQAMQLAVLDVGGKVLSSVFHGQSGALTILHLLVGIVILYIALMLFFSITRLSLGSAGYPLGSGLTGLSTAVPIGAAMALTRRSWSGLTSSLSGGMHARSTFNGTGNPIQSTRGATGQFGGLARSRTSTSTTSSISSSTTNAKGGMSAPQPTRATTLSPGGNTHQTPASTKAGTRSQTPLGSPPARAVNAVVNRPHAAQNAPASGQSTAGAATQPPTNPGIAAPSRLRSPRSGSVNKSRGGTRPRSAGGPPRPPSTPPAP